ncbi:MAG: phosphoglucosamine mutase [Phycisphaerales bacterium]|nr:phosphoglucosamine mutase [Planctomycetota bacterium]MBL6997319.1 phosphoglucosamine mutase [Phycisphaerales bacterium]
MTNEPLMLSVSGARGIVGKTMTPEVAHIYANAFVSFLSDKLGKLPTLCVARDSRPSGPALQDAVAKAFVECGCQVTDLGVVATPTAGVMINALHADGGIIVTASHNPTPWNGIKCLDGDGLAPSKKDATEIIRRFHEKTSLDSKDGGTLTKNTQGNDTHISKLLGVIPPKPIRDKRFRVVLDSINGAGCESGIKLLELLGCDVLHLNGEPTGNFAHPPEPKSENLTDLASMVDKFDADVGFAQDPDADRLAVVDETGFYFGEEYTLVLAAMQWLQTHPNTSTATNLSTSRMIDDVANTHGCKTWRSAVGEANVASVMKKHGCVIGGEGNGGVIFPEVCWVRDSLAGMALILDLIRSKDEPLSAIVQSIQPYEMIKRTIDLANSGGLPAIEKEIERLKNEYGEEKQDDSDGLRIDFDEGWLHVRPSNTEPIARVIAEANDSLTAYKLSNRVKL